MKAIYSLFIILCLNLTACTPKVQLETPPEGITINMNVVVDHKIEVTMDKESKAIIKTRQP
ncbi:YnbE family lipoprotein [Glaesserella parasuis]|nr:YnbE family lipoprotein [Glaesserella parasuis]